MVSKKPVKKPAAKRPATVRKAAEKVGKKPEFAVVETTKQEAPEGFVPRRRFRV
jgi:hypothetical protein